MRLIASLLVGLLASISLVFADENQHFGIQVIDQATGRGIPAITLTTVHDESYVTDSGGWVAYGEQQHFGTEIFFNVTAHGYEVPKDGFGIAGLRVRAKAGEKAQLKLTRRNKAERLYRITGQDIYCDSRKLGLAFPDSNNGQVAGQDSVQAVPFDEQIYWFWGDTNRLSYPLGLFRTAGAVSQTPNNASITNGLKLEYFTDKVGFARAMVDVPNSEGIVWIDGVCVVSSADGPVMLAHFSRRKDLTTELEHGLLLFNTERNIFEVAKTLPLEEKWRHIQHHPIHQTIEGVEYLTFGGPFPLTRVPATKEAVLDPQKYESWTCMSDGKPMRNDDGQLAYHWSDAPPITATLESNWLKSGELQPNEVRFLPTDIDDTNHHVQLHSGTVRWNEFRKRWIVIAVELNLKQQSPSMLGEVWYSESDSAQGPFNRAIKILSHNKQSFYNPCHHDFFDADGGRFIFFEGTYCNTFTNSPATPRYNYNQMMYRLDLEQLKLP